MQCAFPLALWEGYVEATLAALLVAVACAAALAPACGFIMGCRLAGGRFARRWWLRVATYYAALAVTAVVRFPFALALLPIGTVIGIWLYEQGCLNSDLHARRRGVCAYCGYNLTGNVSGICPECGTPLER